MLIQDLADGSRSWASAFALAVLSRPAKTQVLPCVFMYYPVAELNPFQKLLYSSAARADMVVVPVLRLEDIDTIGWGGRRVLHLHWLASVLRSAQEPAEADRLVEQFEARLQGWKRLGIKVVWTVHNLLPHSHTYREAELRLRRVVAQEADLIHVMTADTPERAAPLFELPAERTMHVPHPSYQGWYADVLSKQQARLELGIGPNEFVYLMFGSLQSYKGVIPLLNAFNRLKCTHPSRTFRLIIAGLPSSPEYVREISAHVQENSNDGSIILVPQSVPENQVQTYFHAADFVVAPYLKTLNSGVMLLAATFKRPVIAPRSSSAHEVFDVDTCLLYDDADDQALANAMDDALRHPIKPGKFGAILRKHRPKKISESFFAGLKEMLQLDGAP